MERRQEGFTLLELIVSLALVGILIAVCLIGVRLAVASREAGNDKTDVYQRLRVLHEQLNRTIRSTHLTFVSEPKESLLSDDAADMGPESRRLAFEGGADALKIVTFADPLVGRNVQSSMHQIRVYLKKGSSGRGSQIMLEESEFSPQSFFDKERLDTSQILRIAENAAYLRFRYYRSALKMKAEEDENESQSTETDGEWVDAWNPGVTFSDETTKGVAQESTNQLYMPRAVEISIGIWESSGLDDDQEPKIISLLPIVVPINSGQVFTSQREEQGEGA